MSSRADWLPRLTTPRSHVLLALLLVWGIALPPPSLWPHQVVMAICVFALLVSVRAPWRAVLVPFVHAAPLLIGLFLALWFSRRDQGLVATRVILKALLCILVMSWLRASLGVSELLLGIRSLGVSPLFVHMLSLMMRFLEEIRHEWRRLHRAARSRAIASQPLRVEARLAGLLFVRSLDRSERVHRAMSARGLSFADTPRIEAPSMAEVALVLSGLALIACSVAASVWLG